jgi:hypothetical protein
MEHILHVILLFLAIILFGVAYLMVCLSRFADEIRTLMIERRDEQALSNDSINGRLKRANAQLDEIIHRKEQK